MISPRRRTLSAFASAAILTSGLGAIALLSASTTARADPQYESNPLVGVGSDTIQDLFNAYSGAEPSPGGQPATVPILATTYYSPATGKLVTAAAEGSLGIDSFDATNPTVPYANPDLGDFITTKINGATFDRPNGSGDGRKALDAAIHNATFSNLSQTPESVGGQIDFVRSSSIGSSAAPSTSPLGSDMQYIPFAADGVGYAFICTSVGSTDCTNSLRNVSATDLANLYSGNGKLAAGHWGSGTTENLAACSVYVGSGTFQFFLAKLGLGSDYRAQAQSNLSAAGGSNCTGLEVNNLDSFKSTTAGLAASNTDWIVPMSVASLIAQHNQVALDRSGTFLFTGATVSASDQPGYGIAGVGGGSLPYTGDGTLTWGPSHGYYSGTFGGWVFVVVPTTVLAGRGSNAIKDLFFGAGSALCSTPSKNLMTTFGFDNTLPNDGTYTGGTCGVPAYQGTN